MAGGKDSTSSEYASAVILRTFYGERKTESFDFFRALWWQVARKVTHLSMPQRRLYADFAEKKFRKVSLWCPGLVDCIKGKKGQGVVDLKGDPLPTPPPSHVEGRG